MAVCEQHQNNVYIITGVKGLFEIRIEPSPKGHGWCAEPRRGLQRAGCIPFAGGLSKEEAVTALLEQCRAGIPDAERVKAEVLGAIAPG
jgi:hypothetical protein